MRYYFRQLVLIVMRWLGIIRMFQFIRRNQIIILMIHGVMDDCDNPAWKPLRPQLSRGGLNEYLKILSRRYHFISLSDAVEMIKGRKPVRPYSVVLTFDDGYRNNFTHALPLLRRYDAPATFFVPTGFVNAPKPFWFDRLDYALQQVPVDGREVKVGSLTMCLDGSSREALCRSYKRLRRCAKELRMSDHEFLRDMTELAAQLEEESGRALSDMQANDDWSAIATWDQIRRAIEDGDVSIGAHTVDHIRLDLVDAEVARDQLCKARRDIEVHTGRPCDCLAYPNGNHSQNILDLTQECRYLCAVTTNEGLNHVGDNVFTLRRIDLPVEVSILELLTRLSGLSEISSHIRARLGR